MNFDCRDCKNYRDYKECVMESICKSCKFYMYTAAKITVDPYYSSPEELECEEDSENFMTDDGCYRYEERKEEIDW